MALKEGNKMVQITLPEYHQKKLNTICSKTGLNKSAVIQRLIEGHDIFDHEMLGKEKRSGE